MKNKRFCYLMTWLAAICLLAMGGHACIVPEEKSSQISYPTTTTTSRPSTTTSTIIPSSKVTLHLIVVADTNDPKIGNSVSADSRDIQSTMEAIVIRSNGRLFLNKIVFEGNSITHQNMLNAVDSLRVRANDVILFLYAGHGHRYTSTESKWPLMDTMNHPTDFSTVIEKLRRKYVRQFVALADCCNEVIDVPYRTRITRSNKFLYSNISRMFLTSTVKIAASSSKPGQFAYGDDAGGYFTSAFIENLRNALLYAGGNWEMVLQNTRKDVLEKTGNRQEPQYEKTGN